ncbi:uncharacterized protein LOC116307668, partial [Actinia tenebrosa]|uniref:Uncharacterized protein LOC116307668 n=1 Tax=Actinia tenebrosa TaxID=6105 RepID=A0A6P8JAG4_ACTTE
INECMEKTHTCRPGSICINKEGSYTCPCRDGFYFDRETTKCLPDAVVLNEPEQSNLSLSPEIIAGIVTTIILLLAVIVGGFFYWKRSRNESTCGSEEQDTSKYGRNTNTMMVSQSYEFCNLSFSSMESGPKRSFDAVTATGYPARINGDVEDYCSDSIVIKSHNRHEMTSQKSTRLQTLDEQLESIDV